MGDRYYLPEDSEQPDAPRRARYDILQPQFKQPARPVPARDRYRATQHDNPMYDVVEDENTYSQGPQFDSFGMWSPGLQRHITHIV
jgi:ATP-dependent DNA helicase HFM1/MER3